MAKRKTAPNPLPETTEQLAGDAANPRQMSDKAAAGLRSSLKRFGDLSGIVFNRQTGELVTGHQRMEQIKAEYGELQLVPIDEAAGLYGLRIDEERFFPVRMVDWTPAKQRAANVAANNAGIQGEFTDDLAAYIRDVENQLLEEMPGVLDDVLIADLLEVGSPVEGKQTTTNVQFEAEINESYQVIVQCRDEAHQKEIYDRLAGDGLDCKVLTL